MISRISTHEYLVRPRFAIEASRFRRGLPEARLFVLKFRFLTCGQLWSKAKQHRESAQLQDHCVTPIVFAFTLLFLCASVPADDSLPMPGDLIEAHPDGASKIKDQANALKKEQYAIAIRLINDFPNDFDALRVMGYVHSSHGNLDEMFNCWKRCLALDPKRADIHDQLGRYSMQVENYEDAISYWHDALAIDPELIGVRQNIGSAMLSLGRVEDAVEALQKEIALAPKNSQAHYLLGEAYMQLQQFEQAKASYQSAVKLEPRHKQAYYGLIKTCARLRQRDQVALYAKEFQRLEKAAIEADLVIRRQYDDLRQMREKVAITCTDAGGIYSSRGDHFRAEELWLRATKHDPNHITCRTLLARYYQRAGKVADALRQYQALARVQPGNAGYHRQIGFLQARLGNLPAAEMSLKKMLEVAPESGTSYRALAKFYLNTNRQLTQAESLARRAVELEPVADSFFVLGWAGAKNGRFSAARTALTKAIQLDPDNATYRKLYQSIPSSK